MKGQNPLFSKISAAIAAVILFVATANAQTADPQNTLYLDVKGGRVVIQLRPDWAEKHVRRIKKLTREKFYDGIVFHRVWAGFMAQTGDPTGTGSGGSKYANLKAEFSQVKFIRGRLGMARSQHLDSANSQFFIMYGENKSLNGKYTVFGEVVSGMEHVDALKKGPPAQNGIVRNPDKIIRMQMAADAK
jgi:peptidylprolyl isomerase